jgi:WD40 repeat protein
LVGKVGKLQVTSEVANSKVTLDIGGEKYVFLNPPLSVTGVDECVGGRVVLSNGLAFTNPSNQVENTDDQFGGDGDVLEDFCLRVGTGLPIHPNHLQGHTGPIMLLEEYRGVFYSASQDRTVRAWDIQYGVCIKVYRYGLV